MNNKFVVIEFDKDYHTISDHNVASFKTKEEAEKYCKENNWSGHSYFVEERK